MSSLGATDSGLQMQSLSDITAIEEGKSNILLFCKSQASGSLLEVDLSQLDCYISFTRLSFNQIVKFQRPQLQYLIINTLGI